MPQPSTPHETKGSTLLTSEENQMIVRLLGPRCQSLSTTVVQLFETQAPMHSQWIKKDTGVLCFVRDNLKKNYFFRIYCFKRNKMVWEQEMYNNMDYIASCAFLHTFEGDDCMVCFNFANEDEAREMKTIVDAKILAKRKREGRRMRNSGNSMSSQHSVKNNRNNAQVTKKHTDAARKKEKRKGKLTKEEIGNPSEFRHVLHIGWDPNKGLNYNKDNNDPELDTFFQKAGVSESQLKDTETRQFIYDFIAANGGKDAVLEQELNTKRPPPAIPSSVPGPPVPPRGAPRSTHNRAAPPPPPSGIQPPPRPPPAAPRANNIPIPPPPAGHAPPPPPPPPPMEGFSPASPTPPSMPLFTPEPQPDNRSALMQSIRGGTTLKPVDVDKKVDDARGDLLSEIRKGFQLKPANEREVKPSSPAIEQQNHIGNDLAAALSRALAERNRVIHSDDGDSESSDSNDDEWDV